MACGERTEPKTDVSLPSLFLPHGSPPIPLWPCSSSVFLKEAASRLPRRPRAIVFMSPHFVSDDVDAFVVSAAVKPETIHDFDEDTDPVKRKQLEMLTYPCPGHPTLAREVARRIRKDAGMTCRISETRGMDHGSWTTLYLMFPDADIPVVSLSVKKNLDAAEHIRVGRALRTLSAPGSDVLLLGSGEVVHNVPLMGAPDSKPEPWCVEFESWLEDAAGQTDPDERDKTLGAWRVRAPGALVAHPLRQTWPERFKIEEPFVSPGEHLMPWFFAFGASGRGASVSCVSKEYLGSLPMSAYIFN